jgi:hypothetical protein
MNKILITRYTGEEPGTAVEHPGSRYAHGIPEGWSILASRHESHTEFDLFERGGATWPRTGEPYAALTVTVYHRETPTVSWPSTSDKRPVLARALAVALRLAADLAEDLNAGECTCVPDAPGAGCNCGRKHPDSPEPCPACDCPVHGDDEPDILDPVCEHGAGEDCEVCAAADEAQGSYAACPLCSEPIDHCAGHGEHNLCEPGEPCEADDCPARDDITSGPGERGTF